MVYCEQMMMKEEEEDKEEGREDKISSSQTFIFLLFSQRTWSSHWKGQKKRQGKEKFEP
jgi:hypothetical protein